MHGNVEEWCRDWYGEDYYGKSPQPDPKGPQSGTYRVLRGGSWFSNPRHCRAAYRFRHAPVTTLDGLGFRVLCVSEPDYEPLKNSDDKLQEVIDQVEEAFRQIESNRDSRIKRIKETKNFGKYAAIGILKKSNVNLRRYRLVAESGRTICYAEPVGQIARKSLAPFLNREVGLIGTIKAHAPSKSALVEFTNVVLFE